MGHDPNIAHSKRLYREEISNSEVINITKKTNDKGEEGISRTLEHTPKNSAQMRAHM